MAEAVILPKPVSGTRLSPFVWIVLAIYMGDRIIEVLPFTRPSTPLVAIEIVSALTFALVDGTRRFGLRSILMFAAICLMVGGLIEGIGVRTGLPFGHYEFLPLMGPQVMNVPVLLGLAYVGMAYASWAVALLVAGVADSPLSGRQLIAVPLLASVVMTSWDLAQDPVWSTLLHAWRWRDGGAWFGVPLSNYGGWLLTTLLIYLAFAVQSRGIGPAQEPTLDEGWIGLVILYGLCALGNILQLLKPRATSSISDNIGIYWRANSILCESAIVSAFIMGGFAATAVMRGLKTIRER